MYTTFEAYFKYGNYNFSLSFQAVFLSQNIRNDFMKFHVPQNTRGYQTRCDLNEAFGAGSVPELIKSATQ